MATGPRARLVSWLLACYPRWFRETHGEDLERSYLKVLDEADLADTTRRSRLRTLAWLARDAITTGTRARLARASPGRLGGGPAIGPLDVRSANPGRMEMMRHELAHAARSLRRSPGFTTVAVLTLGLGIGLNVSVFDVVQSILLEPLPYDEPSELVQLQNRYLPGGQVGWVSAPEYWIFREESTTIAATAALTPDNANLTGLPRPLRLQGLLVEPGYFSLLGASAQLGRTFLPEEARAGADPVVVISDGLWRTAFGADLWPLAVFFVRRQ